MLGLLERRRDRVAAHLLNTFCSWEGSGSKYVAGFQKNLDGLAIALSGKTDLWLKARYNNLLSCAEIFSPCDRTIAFVAVTGEMCLPLTAHVYVPTLPTSEIQELFQKHLRFPQYGEGPLSGVDVCFKPFV